MNKRWIAVINIAVIILTLLLVAVYLSYQSGVVYAGQVSNFESMTATMEQVTENYLEGEQGICDVWAKYINSQIMTLEEAAAFVHSSHRLESTSAHLIYADTLLGVSTRPSPGDDGRYDVSYVKIDLFSDMSWISDEPGALNVSRAFTNPQNGEQSLAFCSRIGVTDGGKQRVVILMRIVPISEFEQKWVFPQENFMDAELAMIDSGGSYIIKGKSFKNTNFFEFYKSYNKTDPATLESLFDKVTASSGSLEMTDSYGRECVIAHIPVRSIGGWTMLSYIPADNLKMSGENWVLIGIVSAGLLILFILDLVYMLWINRQLQKITREAESANRAKTEFLSTMSHDIRTPMNAIIGLTTLAERNIGDTEAVGENLRKITLASNHLLTLINDILDISKVESGKLNLSPLTFSIVESVENLVNISQPMVKEKNIDFSFRTNRMEKEYLYADQLRLNQIYINILSNAIKYTEPGGSVSVDLREEESAKPGCVRSIYTVADTGIGMSPEFMAKMYQPFSRQTDSRVNSIQGTGLGLAITKQMVELMNGTIDCRSEVGKGTTFKITLDIPFADRQLEEMRLDPIDVLIVDDDEILLETAAETLESLGVKAEKTDSGMSALGMIRHRMEAGGKYDVVIVDWKMAGMDGIETVRRIRSEIGEIVPIILISAYDWSDIEEEAKAAGASGFISKPLFRSTLYEKISELLGVEAKALEPEEDYSDIAGMNILIAEDNDINWEIINAMLSMFGITSERAKDGRICVDMMREAEDGKYSLIFMDIQMPVMNGLEATRTIRQMDGEWASSIPIIAMTADAFSENVTECLQAGMNGHIAKPIDIKLVIKEIRRIKEGKK